MDASAKPNRIHPLVATAAVSVTLVSLVGIAAITGLLPTSHGTNSPEASQPAVAPDAKVAATSDEKAKASAPTSSPKTAEQHYAPRPAAKYHAPVAQAPAICHSCGRIESIQAVQQQAEPSGVGIAAGAILGGVLGHQVGGGNGKTLATVAGAVGGGYAGNEVEKRTRSTTTYQVRVRMEDGSLRSFPQSSEGWRVGDRVKVVNGALTEQG